MAFTDLFEVRGVVRDECPGKEPGLARGVRRRWIELSTNNNLNGRTSEPNFVRICLQIGKEDLYLQPLTTSHTLMTQLKDRLTR
jgi:hypothetical protein